MDLDWSAQSPHIRSLCAPWHLGDGYEEAAIAAGEVRCGVRLPATVRRFYEIWGRRHDLTQMNEILLAPDQWVIHSGALIFCVENQSCAYWALPLIALEDDDPPVVEADSGPEMSVWDITTEFTWRRRQRVSAFLDDLAYEHAFSGGALFGACSARLKPETWQVELLERDWRKGALEPLQIRAPYAADWAGHVGSPLFIRQGRALQWFDRFNALAHHPQALDEIARELRIVWQKVW